MRHDTTAFNQVHAGRGGLGNQGGTGGSHGVGGATGGEAGGGVCNGGSTIDAFDSLFARNTAATDPDFSGQLNTANHTLVGVLANPVAQFPNGNLGVRVWPNFTVFNWP